MPKLRLGKLTWIDLAAQAVSPAIEAIGLVRAKRRQKALDQEIEHQANEMEALRRRLSEKDSEISDLQTQVADYEEKLAQTHQTIERLQQELASERNRPWWKKALSALKGTMGSS